MKGVLDWVKKNLLIVIFSVLILALLPVAFVFSSGWNAKIKKSATDEYNKQRQALQRASSVNYALPTVFEGEQAVAESRAPNSAVTEFYRAQSEARTRQVGEVVDRGTRFNRRSHRALIEGLLPKAPSDRARRQLGLELAEQIAGTVDPDGTVVRPSIYRALVRRVNGGEPASPVELGAALAEYKARQEQDYAASNSDGRITDDQAKRLGDELVARRLGDYAGRAKSLAFFIAPDALIDDGAPGWTGVPAPRRTDVTDYPPVTESVAYVWQWDYWIISDILDAVALANTDPATGTATVANGAVKRVEKVRVAAFDVASNAGGDDLGLGQDDDGSFGGRDAQIPARYATTPSPSLGGGGSPVAPSATYTGRIGDTGGGVYDVRQAELVAVVASQKLPALIDAIGRTNYMTVVDVDLAPVDVWGDLNQGYYYGADHVVRATIQIETVWLRSWTESMMPDPVRTKLGLPPLGGGEGDVTGDEP